jgi:hypothetical protein
MKKIIEHWTLSSRNNGSSRSIFISLTQFSASPDTCSFIPRIEVDLRSPFAIFGFMLMGSGYSPP